MSKAMVLALAITESAALSFRSSGQRMIERACWHETLDSSGFHKLVNNNLKPVKTLFFVQDNTPTLADFRDFKNEYVAEINEFMKWGSVRAFFALLEAEKELGERIPEDFFSETAFDYVLEDCQNFFGE